MQSKKPASDKEANSTRVSNAKDRLTKSEIMLLQRPLTRRLEDFMEAEGMDMRALADALKVPYSYLGSVLTGDIWLAQSSRDRVEAFATFLKVPFLQIWLWVGCLKPEDFVVKSDLDERLNLKLEELRSPDHADDLNEILRLARKDISISQIMPPVHVTQKWDTSAKLAFVQLYEIASGRYLFDHIKGETDIKDTKPLFKRPARTTKAP